MKEFSNNICQVSDLGAICLMSPVVTKREELKSAK